MLRKIIRECDPLPRFYGAAYVKSGYCDVVCYPIPINLIIALIYRAWQWIHILNGIIKVPPDKNWERGFKVGLKVGRYDATGIAEEFQKIWDAQCKKGE